MTLLPSAQKRVYDARQYVRRQFGMVARLLPEGYRTGTRMWRLSPAYAWRDPVGRFHVVCVSRWSRMPVTVSFWAEELGQMLKLRSLEMAEFTPDPLLSLAEVTNLERRKLAPKGWLRQVLRLRQETAA